MTDLLDRASPSLSLQGYGMPRTERGHQLLDPAECEMDGDELLNARHALGLYQGELAEWLGYTERYVRQMEAGTATIRPAIALAVRYLLDRTR